MEWMICLVARHLEMNKKNNCYTASEYNKNQKIIVKGSRAIMRT